MHRKTAHQAHRNLELCPDGFGLDINPAEYPEIFILNS